MYRQYSAKLFAFLGTCKTLVVMIKEKLMTKKSKNPNFYFEGPYFLNHWLDFCGTYIVRSKNFLATDAENFKRLADKLTI